MNKQASLTRFQYFALIIGVMLANGIISLPRVVADDGGRSAWVVILVAGAIILSIALMAEVLAKIFPNQDPASWSVKLLGPFFGRVWMVMYLLRAMVFVVLTSRLYSTTLNARVLVLTPNSVLAILVTITAVAVSYTHMRGMARYAELAFFLTLPVLVLNIMPVRYGHTFHLFPVFADTGLSNFIKAIEPAAYSFAGFDILWFAYPYLRNKQKSLWTTATAIGFITVLYSAVTMVAIMFFGLERLRVINYPTAALVSVTEVIFLERLDSLAFHVWLVTVALTGGAQMYIAARMIEGIFPVVTFNKAAMGIGAFLTVLSIGEYPGRLALQASDIYGTIDIVFIAATALLFPLLAYIKRRRQSKSADS